MPKFTPIPDHDSWTPVTKRRKPPSNSRPAYKVRTSGKYRVLVFSPPAVKYLGDYVEMYFNDEDRQVLFVGSTKTTLNAYKIATDGKGSHDGRLSVPTDLQARLPDTDWIMLDEMDAEMANDDGRRRRYARALKGR